MPISIRPATIDDLDRIVLFNQAMARETEGRDLERGTLRAGVRALFEDPSRGRYFVAEREPSPTASAKGGDAPPAQGERENPPTAAAEPGEGGGAGPAVEARVVGQLLVTTEWSDWRNAEVWWIQSVYVSKEARREGVYRTLHDEVRRRAKETGAAGLRLYVDRDNRGARETYEALGMRRSHYVMFEEMWK